MAVAAGAKSPVFRLASRVVLHGDARPMVDGVAQADVGGLAHEHEAALAGSLGDGRHTRQASKGRVARIRSASAMPSTPFWAHAMRTDSGRPSSSMRLSTWTATSISVAR